MVGSIPKSAADQIELGELITTYTESLTEYDQPVGVINGTICIAEGCCGSRAYSNCKHLADVLYDVRTKGSGPAFKPGRVLGSRPGLRVLTLPLLQLVDLTPEA